MAQYVDTSKQKRKRAIAQGALAKPIAPLDYCTSFHQGICAKLGTANILKGLQRLMFALVSSVARTPLRQNGIFIRASRQIGMVTSWRDGLPTYLPFIHLSPWLKLEVLAKCENFEMLFL